MFEVSKDIVLGDEVDTAIGYCSCLKSTSKVGPFSTSNSAGLPRKRV